MLRVRTWEGCSVIYELAASFKAEKRKVNVSDAWFRVSPLSVCLSVYLSLSWSSESVGVVCLLLISARCRKICLLYRFSFLIESDGVFLVLVFFLPRRPRIGWKITYNYFYFLTYFIDISLCSDPMRRNPPFSILKKVSEPITSGECSRGR